MKQKLDLLFRLSSYFGRNFIYTQGGGGNVSFKNQEFMWIKPSGTRLKEIKSEKLLTKLDLNLLHTTWNTLKRKRVCGFNINSILKETSLNLNNSVIPTGQYDTPSVETFMHLLLGNFVVHSHFLPGIFLTSASISDKLLASLKQSDPTFKFKKLSYHTPGIPLATAMESIIDESDQKKGIFLLKNHGIVMSSESDTVIYDNIKQLEKLFTDVTGLSSSPSFSFNITYLPEKQLYEFKTDLPYINPDDISSPLTIDYILSFKNNFSKASNYDEISISQQHGLIFYDNKIYFKATNDTYKDYAEILAGQIQSGLWANQLACTLNFLTEQEFQKFTTYAIGKYAR